MQISRGTGRGLRERTSEGRNFSSLTVFFSAAQPYKYWGKSLGERSYSYTTHTNTYICSSVQKLEEKKPFAYLQACTWLRGSAVVSVWGLAHGANICCYCGLGSVTILILCLLNLPHSTRALAHKLSTN